MTDKDKEETKFKVLKRISEIRALMLISENYGTGSLSDEEDQLDDATVSEKD